MNHLLTLICLTFYKKKGELRLFRYYLKKRFHKCPSLLFNKRLNDINKLNLKL